MMNMKFFFKTLQTFSVLIFITACGGGGGGGASFSITANSQSFSTDEDAIFIGNLTALTSTASTVTFQKFSDPSYGTIDLNPDGGFSYNPQAEFSGNDSFQFTATSAENSTVSSPGTVSITVNAINDSPIVQSLILLKHGRVCQIS
jgi:VCBS repeat-containing protein